jgi:elongation factor G
VISGVHGVEVQTEKAWEFGEDMQLPMAFYISKMERENADFERTLSEIQDYLSDKAVPLFLPVGKEAAFKGVVDVLRQKAYMYKGDGSSEFNETDVPSDLADYVTSAREVLVERIVEADDELMMRYLEGEQLSMEELVPALRKSVLSRSLFPVLPGASTSNVGVCQLLDAIAEVLPGPLDMPPRKALKGDSEVMVEPDPAGKFSAFCFKIMVDPYVGKLSFIRVFSGSASSENPLYNLSRGEDERVSAFKVMRARNRWIPGMWLLGTLWPYRSCTAPLWATPGGQGMDFISPRSSSQTRVQRGGQTQEPADEDKLANALNKMLERTRPFTSKESGDQRQCPFSSDLHIDVMLSKTRNGTGLNWTRRLRRFPTGDHKETLQGPGKVQKTDRGRGQYGDVHIEFVPLSGDGFLFEGQDRRRGSAQVLHPCRGEGASEAPQKGSLQATHRWTSRPVSSSVPITMWTRRRWPSDSRFMAFKKGMVEASPVLLEPIMNVEVVVPEDYLGDVMGDLTPKGQDHGIDSRGRLQVVKAQVPLAEMFRYAIILRSMTSGRGNFTMEFSH